MKHGSRDPRPRSNPEWPAIPYAEWADTCATLHRMTQVVGKVRLARTRHVNHWWQVPLYVSTRGLTTSPMPYGTRMFEMEFDLHGHRLEVRTDDGHARDVPLQDRSVAEFYAETMEALASLGLETPIWTRPVEVENPIPFEEDTEHDTYVPEQAHRFWRALAQADRVLTDFRAGFTGKCSPVHFFWGSFDLAVTRFSGRPAPRHPGGIPNLSDRVVREAYSSECSSCGLWPGGPAFGDPAFYAYAYPAPAGFASHPVRPAQAFFSEEMQEFLLPYEAVRTADDPDAALTAFLETTYEAAAEHGGWNRAALERRVEVEAATDPPPA